METAITLSHILSASSSSEAVVFNPSSVPAWIPAHAVREGAGLHELFQHVLLPWAAAVLHEPLQCDTVLQKQTVLACDPVRSQVLPLNLHQCKFLSTVSQILTEACFPINCLQAQNLLQMYTSSSMGSSEGCRWISAVLCITIGRKCTAA